ncbi:MAG TPA: hypothetical protein VLN58_05410 [Verrucomicrobiae bacterium]|nr:hypothetical protein [Verrucomicrobiae bacterium]
MDSDGVTPIVRVKLGGFRGGVATLFAEDFDRLVSQGYCRLGWFQGNTSSGIYVTCRREGETLYLSRLVANAIKGDRISYRDGDRLNLRRSNLIFVKSWRETGKKLVPISAS